MVCNCSYCKPIYYNSRNTMYCSELNGVFVLPIMIGPDSRGTPYLLLGKSNYEIPGFCECRDSSCKKYHESRVGKYCAIGEKIEPCDNGCLVNTVRRAFAEEYCISYSMREVRNIVLANNMYRISGNGVVVVAMIGRMDIKFLNYKISSRVSNSIELTEMEEVQLFRLADVVCGYNTRSKINGFDKRGYPIFDRTRSLVIYKPTLKTIVDNLSMVAHSGFPKTI